MNKSEKWMNAEIIQNESYKINTNGWIQILNTNGWKKAVKYKCSLFNTIEEGNFNFIIKIQLQINSEPFIFIKMQMGYSQHEMPIDIKTHPKNYLKSHNWSVN